MSEEVKKTVPGELEIEYGPGKNQKLDIYGIDLPSGNLKKKHLNIFVDASIIII